MEAYWRGHPPASEQEIDKLKAVVRFELPPDYLALLRRHNGGEGPIALPPLWLQLWSVHEVIEFSRLRLPAWQYPDYFFFAANGAAERIAMRRAPSGALEIVSVDSLAGGTGVNLIADDFATFVAAIGK